MMACAGNTPEMKQLRNIDITFLPMNLPYTMTPEMVADAAKGFRPVQQQSPILERKGLCDWVGSSYRTRSIFLTFLYVLPPPSSGSTTNRQRYVPLDTLPVQVA